MNVDLGIWDKLTRVIFFLLFVAAVIAVGVWYSPVISANERMRKRRLDLDARIAHEQEVSRNLQEALHSMQNPRTIERLARERLTYAKPGETVIHFEAPPGGSKFDPVAGTEITR